MITLFLIKTKGKEFTIFLYSSILYFILFIFLFGFFNSFIFYLTCFLVLKIYSSFKVRSNNIFDIYFGCPGVGKSTFATDKALKYLNKNIPVFTMNLDVPGCISINKDDISCNNSDLHDCLLIIDESGLDFNNRDFKTNFTKDSLRLFKFHRHYNIDVMILSQSYSDMDLKLRNLATRLFVLNRSFIPFFIKSKMISKKISIDDTSKQIIDNYFFVLFSSYYVFMPRTWKYFNSFSK